MFQGLDRQRKYALGTSLRLQTYSGRFDRYETLLDSSDEGSEDDDSEAVPKKARFKKAWIKESEDEPVDFLDAGVVKKVLGKYAPIVKKCRKT